MILFEKPKRTSGFGQSLVKGASLSPRPPARIKNSTSSICYPPSRAARGNSARGPNGDSFAVGCIISVNVILSFVSPVRSHAPLGQRVHPWRSDLKHHCMPAWVDDCCAQGTVAVCFRALELIFVRPLHDIEQVDILRDQPIAVSNPGHDDSNPDGIQNLIDIAEAPTHLAPSRGQAFRSPVNSLPSVP